MCFSRACVHVRRVARFLDVEEEAEEEEADLSFGFLAGEGEEGGESEEERPSASVVGE